MLGGSQDLRAPAANRREGPDHINGVVLLADSACEHYPELCPCTQAMSTQEANRAASNKMPPLWAAAAIVLLGWNEFLAVLYNPLWLFIGLIIFLFGKVKRMSQR